MKKFIALFLVFSLVVLSGNLFAKERRGADLLIQKTDGQQVGGELIAVKQNSLLLKDSESGADVSVDISDIKVIKVEKESKAWKGVLYGSLISGLIGALYLGSSCEVHNPICRDYALGGGAIGAAAGALIGGLIGAVSGADEIIEIEEKSDSEIKEALKELRKKARIPDFQ